MVVYEDLNDGNIKSYSDSGFYIHGGNPEADYIIAVDPADLERKYTETSTRVTTDEVTEADYVKVLKKVGVIS